MIGTPAEYSAAKVRDQRARAIFWTVTPILKGMRRRTWSHWGRPQDDDFHARNPKNSPAAPAISRYHWPVTSLDIWTVTFVIIGSSPPKSLKTFTNTGTMNAIRPTSTISAKVRTTAG